MKRTVSALLLGSALALGACMASTVDGTPRAASCGTGTDAASVKSTIHCFLQATAHADFDRACAVLSAAARTRAVSNALKPGTTCCADATRQALALLPADKRAKIKSLDSRVRITGVTVDGTSATATLRATYDGKETVTPVRLVVEDRGWRVN